MHYSPLTYYTLGNAWPRERTRQAYPRRRRRCQGDQPAIISRRPYGPVYNTACTLGRVGLGCTLVTRVH